MTDRRPRPPRARLRRRALLAILVIAVTGGAGTARADEPLPAPHSVRVCSPSTTFCAVSDPDPGETTVYEVAAPDGTERARWSIPGWYRQLAVSDGGVLVTGYDGLNLVPRDDHRDLTMLAFHAGGEPIARITLADLFDDLDALEATVSHYRWGSYVGWDRDGRYRVETVEGRVLAFDPSTGQQVGASRPRAPRLRVALYVALGFALVAAIVWLVRRGRG